jgi:formylglycine-generating enzyme required for sulfatase activity
MRRGLLITMRGKRNVASDQQFEFCRWTRFRGRTQVFSALLVTILSFAQRAFPQASAVLNVQLFAGLSITGTIGSVYSIQYATSLATTNNWNGLTNITLLSSPFLWIDTTAPVAQHRYYRAEFVQPPTPTNMVWMPPGTFMMGSPTNEAGRDIGETQHLVLLTKGFYIGKFLVTQSNYVSVIGYNPSYFTNDLARPVDSVTWYEATNYCYQLTKQEQETGRLPTTWSYRLPTEAEWEYACRAGTTTAFSYGYDPNYARLGYYSWYFENSGGSPHQVGTKLPNPWGLYDMHGNVYEHCSDFYAPYDLSIVTDPKGPSTGSNHVVRGGTFNGIDAFVRSASRSAVIPSWIHSDTGFRVVLASDSP